MPFPPSGYFVGSAVFHYLGPALAVLLFAQLEPLGVAGLRIWGAAVVFAAWRRPALRRIDRTVAAWGAVLAAMNTTFYLAIDRLPLGTVAAIEFLPVVALATLGARTARNVLALIAAVGGVALLTDAELAGEPVGLAFAFANAGLFAVYIVLAHRMARRPGGGVDGLAAAMVTAAVLVVPFGTAPALPAASDPAVLAAGLGVGICSSVIPYVLDQLAMERLPRATYALMTSLLPATAAVTGALVLGQFPTTAEAAGIALVIGGVASHRDPG